MEYRYIATAYDIDVCEPSEGVITQNEIWTISTSLGVQKYVNQL